MKKQNPLILTILGVAYSVMIAVIVCICLFGQGYIYRYYKEFPLSHFISVGLGVSAYVGLLGIISFILKKIQNFKAWDILMIVLSSLLTCLLYIFAYHYCFKTGWDVSHVLNNVELLAKGKPALENYSYFSIYPNNICLANIYILFYKLAYLLGMENGYYMLLVLQSVIYAWTGYFVYRIADMIFRKEKQQYSLLAWFVYMCLVGLSPWIVVPYSDGMGLLLVSAGFFFYFKIFEGGRWYWNVFGLSVCSFLGYHIKPQIFIVMIAVVMITLVTEYRGIFQNLRKSLMTLLIAVVTAVSITLLLQFAADANGFPKKSEERYGVTHFLMMGLNLEQCGAVNSGDCSISDSFPTYEERCVGNLAEAKRRIKNLGISGLLQLAFEKTLSNYSDGTFAWSQEGAFYTQLYENGNDFLRYFLRGFYYEFLAHHDLFKGWVQAFWLGTLFLNIFVWKSCSDKRIASLALAIVGVTLFGLIFEARARYLLCYAPVYILLGTVGLSNVIANMRLKLRKKCT